ncbi:MAG: TM0106 family RecB-like putative nuclease, partial [Actinomycetota bacterium]|nr:TM0106 family RecB-like putative nuclease [Actinomycetota bacterium]
MARRLSPSRLNDFLGCEHRTYLDLLADRGELEEEPLQPNAQLLVERGQRHEEEFRQRLVEQGRDVVSLPTEGTAADRAAATVRALRGGADVVHQACFLHDGWLGYADFLISIPEPSELGAYSYEVYDAKLGSQPKPKHIFQLLFYNRELERLQGRRPQRVHLVLGSGEEPAFNPEEFDAYAARVVKRFLARREELEGASADPAYPYPVEDCDFCPWWKHCRDRRRSDDHLSLVAGLHRSQGLKLEAHGIPTVVALADLESERRVTRLPAATLANLRAQADLQVRSRGRDIPLYDLLEPAHDHGLHRLPRPSDGDVFFDFEGDPYWGDDGLEYLFGSYVLEDGTWRYKPLWATSRAEEKQAFETWMDWVTERLRAYPDSHVFHYNAYEPTAIKRLMARHATREHELDELLRRRIFVDLYGIVRQAARIGTESYGLKAIEPLVGFERDAELRGAIGSLRRWQSFADDGDRAHLEGIAGYNEDDCAATLAVREWLMARRPDAEAKFGMRLDALEPEPEKPLSDKMRAYVERLERARELLTPGLPDDESHDTSDERARRVAFDLLGYHRRESKPGWWQFYARRDERTIQQLRDEDTEAIGDLTPAPGSEREEIKKSWQWRLTFPEQEFKLGDGKAHDPVADSGVTIVSLDEATRTVIVKRGKAQGDAPPRALAPGWPYSHDAQIGALFRFVDRVHLHGLTPCGAFDAATDLLTRRPPRFAAGAPPLRAGSVDLDVLREQVASLDGSALVIQGPPGSGKTWTAARLAVGVMRRGCRVGVVATSHKAIVNLLRAIDEYADEEGFDFRGWKKASGEEGNDYESTRIMSAGAPPKDVEFHLVAGTAWHWAREEEYEAVETLFVDEAGQMSLADAIAVSQGARNVVLLGDPQQLAHVSQGTHPHGSGASVLEHMLAGRDTVPPDRGVLLDRSWRMHPEVCRLVSDTMYDRRLTSIDACSRQSI